MKLTDITVQNPYPALPSICYELSDPQPLQEPRLITADVDTAQGLGIDPCELDTKRFIDLLNGAYLFKGARPFATAYAGYQFGSFIPDLGDGRAHHIGTLEGFELQLKGSGRTRYSRHGDGRATLEGCVREHLASIWMHNASIPTTRTLGVIASNQTVRRKKKAKKCAIICRISTSWVRFGTFEYLANLGEYEALGALVNYVVDRHFPHLKGKGDSASLLFNDVAVITARLIAQWQSIGFVHGVLNTDNMSIVGATLDYGPFGFMDRFDSSYTPNTSDTYGRYRFENQPAIAKWNLERLANALAPVGDKRFMDRVVEMFDAIYTRYYHYYMCKKLGFEATRKEDVGLIGDLVEIADAAYGDWTRFFYLLSRYEGDREALYGLIPQRLSARWLDRYDKRIAVLDTKERLAQMQRTNPAFTLSNRLLQEAIDGLCNGDRVPFEYCLQIARNPFGADEALNAWIQEASKTQPNQRLSCAL